MDRSVKFVLGVGVLGLAQLAASMSPPIVSQSTCGEYAAGGSIFEFQSQTGTRVELACTGAPCCEPVITNIGEPGEHFYCGCPLPGGGHTPPSNCCHPIVKRARRSDGTIGYARGSSGDCDTTECTDPGRCGLTKVPRSSPLESYAECSFRGSAQPPGEESDEGVQVNTSFGD